MSDLEDHDQLWVYNTPDRLLKLVDMGYSFYPKILNDGPYPAKTARYRITHGFPVRVFNVHNQELTLADPPADQLVSTAKATPTEVTPKGWLHPVVGYCTVKPDTENSLKVCTPLYDSTVFLNRTDQELKAGLAAWFAEKHSGLSMELRMIEALKAMFSKEINYHSTPASTPAKTNVTTDTPYPFPLKNAPKSTFDPYLQPPPMHSFVNDRLTRYGNYY